MKIWILGANGLLGRELSALCTKREIPYLATGREVNILEQEQLQFFAQEHSPTHIINCAAYTNVDLAEKEKNEAFAVNATGPKYLAQIAKRQKIRLLHLSTDYVFNGEKNSYYTEEDACNPENIYGMSKQLGEQWIVEELPTACIVRTSWLLGRGGKNFFSNLLSLMQTNEQLQVDNTQISRLTSATDLSKILLQMLDCFGIWHFANRGKVTRFQVASHFLQRAIASGFPLYCKQVLPASKKGETPRPAFSALATNKIEAIIGPIRPWQEII